MNRVAILALTFLYGCAAPTATDSSPAAYVGTWASEGRPSVLFQIDSDLKLTRYIYTDAQGVAHDLTDKTTLTRSGRDVVLAGKGPQGNDFSIVLSQPSSRFVQGQVSADGRSFSVQYWKQ